MRKLEVSRLAGNALNAVAFFAWSSSCLMGTRKSTLEESDLRIADLIEARGRGLLVIRQETSGDWFRNGHRGQVFCSSTCSMKADHRLAQVKGVVQVDDVLGFSGAHRREGSPGFDAKPSRGRAQSL